jgi:hypothetical protein
MSVIFGYGIVVSIKKFVKLFPGSFVYNKKYNYWNEGTIENLEKGKGIKFYYNGHVTDFSKATVFITTENAEEFDCYKNTFVNPYTNVTIDQLTEKSVLLESWLIEHFPYHKMELTIYGKNY